MDGSLHSPPGDDHPRRLTRLDPAAITAWLLGFGLVVYLSLRGGGYDSIVRNQVGIAIWWIAIAGILVGALPIRRPGPPALAALCLLGAYVVWTALSISWTESSERTAADLGRVTTYLGIFALALLVRGPKGTRRMVAALGAGIAVVSLLALASRLHPAWFPGADQTGQFLTDARNRLSYPLNYWNGLAVLVALGLPLILHLASSTRSAIARSVAAGVLPAMVLTIYFTYSRGGAVAALVGALLFLALTSDRVPATLTTLIAAAGGAILIAAASKRDALEAGLLNGPARDQGNEMLLMTVIVGVAVALLQAGLTWGFRQNRRPAWTAPSRTQSVRISVCALLVALAAGVALGVPGRVSDAWSEFRSAQSPGQGATRLESFRGNGRYQYWSSSDDQNSADPVTGGGSGTFEYWWARNGDLPGFVRDAHSLYLETWGELGAVGLLLLGGFLATILAAGLARTVAAARRQRAQLAAALAGCSAFCVAAAFDWIWELAVIPVAFLLLAAVIVTAGDTGEPSTGHAWSAVPRAVAGLTGLVAIIAIAVPLSSASLIRDSQRDVAASDLGGALDAARSAQNVQPEAATPRLQEALVLELQGRVDAAVEAARSATEKEPTNWRTWAILSRLEAERGAVRASIASYRRARALNPRSALFSG
jgi:hypothetical protein